ncbi:MAG: SAM-dependent methyltransferase [Flavobacteriales bacterium]|nr:SAM-dependent methyltransferase [Flavobacteriales bacterium]|tara:strand:- start:22136 stop:22858 length:723 start_codon:yes stop_codon:yes gene_type:complete
MEWFKNWFDSPYYHILYKERNSYEAEYFIDNLIKYLKIPEKSKIIDIACGKGRHSIYLEQKKMKVTGIDLSQKSINHAKKFENDNLFFFKHDMRKKFQKETYDAALNLFTSFGYFKTKNEHQTAIDAMALNLKKEGLLIIDFMNVNKTINNLVSIEEKKINDILFNITRSVKGKYIQKEITFKHNDKNYNFLEKVMAFTISDLSNFIINAKLEIINIFGDYDLNPFCEYNSDRLILICKK